MKKKIISKKELEKSSAGVKSDNVTSRVWLLIGLFHSLPGKLTLQNGRLVFTLFHGGTMWINGLRKLEQNINLSGLAEHLDNNQMTEIFNIPIQEIQAVSFPWYYFMAGIHITVHHYKFRISFIQPQNTKAYRYTNPVPEIHFSRKTGKWWKEKLIQS